MPERRIGKVAAFAADYGSDILTVSKEPTTEELQAVLENTRQMDMGRAAMNDLAVLQLAAGHMGWAGRPSHSYDESRGPIIPDTAIMSDTTPRPESKRDRQRSKRRKKRGNV